MHLVPSNRITPEGIHAKLNINFVVDVIKGKTFVNVKNSFLKCLSKDLWPSYMYLFPSILQWKCTFLFSPNYRSNCCSEDLNTQPSYLRGECANQLHYLNSLIQVCSSEDNFLLLIDIMILIF